METSPVSSLEFFKINWTCWTLLGIKIPPNDPANPRQQQKRNRYLAWSFVVNGLASVSFPFHLAFGIFNSKSKSLLIDSIAITITSFGAVIKLLIIANKQRKNEEMKAILRILDARVTHKEEVTYYQEHIRLNIANIQRVFSTLYLVIGLSAVGVFFFSDDDRLFYQGWLPFDWHESGWFYALACVYQLFCIFFQFLQTYSNDSFAPKALCLLSAHIELLYMRVARIGNENGKENNGETSLVEQEEELNRCVLDQINLYELCEIIQDIISWPTFVQIFVSVANNCVAMLALLFFITKFMDRFYYITYILGMWIQLFPTCYYGSDFALLFEQLHYAVFSCNWIGQSKSFKRHMMIFTERSLRKTIALAGGIFPIHLDTFFATCKGAYSLFAVIMTMK